MKARITHGQRLALKLPHDEAVEAAEKIKGFIEFARKSGMDGIGWKSDCPICGDDGFDQDRQDIVNTSILMGDTPRHIAQYYGIAPDGVFRHRTHLIAGFWAHGMGPRIAADGHYFDFPKDGDGKTRMEWYRAKFQWLAYQAERDKDMREMRNCFKEAAQCDKAIIVLEDAASDPNRMRRALDLSPDHEARIADAAKRREQAVIESRPRVEANEEIIEMKSENDRK